MSVPGSWSVETIGKAGGRRAESFLSRIPLVADPSRRLVTFSIFPTDLEPGKG